MLELNWEEIPHDNGFVLRRTKVFNGWLVAAISDVKTPSQYSNGYVTCQENYEWRTSITFVPDPNHEWKL